MPELYLCFTFFFYQRRSLWIINCLSLLGYYISSWFTQSTIFFLKQSLRVWFKPLYTKTSSNPCIKTTDFFFFFSINYHCNAYTGCAEKVQHNKEYTSKKHCTQLFTAFVRHKYLIAAAHLHFLWEIFSHPSTIEYFRTTKFCENFHIYMYACVLDYKYFLLKQSIDKMHWCFHHLFVFTPHRNLSFIWYTYLLAIWYKFYNWRFGITVTGYSWKVSLWENSCRLQFCCYSYACTDQIKR